MEKVFNLELSEVASPEIVKQVEEILLAVPKEESKKAITFDNFHNLIRVMYNIDYIYLEDVLSEEEFTDLRFDPCGFFIHTDDKKAHAIWNAAMKRYGGKDGTNA
jgi:hypothetical protein